MRETIMYENYCHECAYSWDSKPELSENCPNCGKRHIYRNPYITCGCGTRVYLDGNSNQCEECGTYYNRFGQQLRDPSEWEEDW